MHLLCVQADVVTINQRPLELQLLQASTGVLCCSRLQAKLPAGLRWHAALASSAL